MTDNNPILEEIFQEEDMAQERSTLTKNRKIEKSFEDLLTGLSDENDDDIDDLVDFDNLPEMCSDATLIAITKSNKPYTNAASMDDSLRMSEFDDATNFTSKSSKTNDTDLFSTDDFFTQKSNGKEEYVENEKLIDFEESEVIKTEKTDELFEYDTNRDDVKEEDKLIDFDDQEDNDDDDISDEKIDEENSTGSNEVDEDDDKYEPNFVDRSDEKVDVMLTDETGNAVDIMDQDTEVVVNGLQREESIDLDAIVQDNTHLDVDIGKQKTVLRKKGSLAKRRKPSRTSIHSMGAADENSRYSDSTEPKPVMQNGHTDEDVFARNSSSSIDSDVQSPPAKKPLPGMVALPGMGMPMGFPKRKSRGSTPSDSDLTPDEAKKDFRNIGVKLPISSSSGSSESDNQTNITSPKLRKTSDQETLKSPVEPTHQFEKPKLKAVSRPVREREDSDDSKTFDMPALKQVEKSPTKSRASEQNDDMDTKHVFQTPKLRRVDDAPTESLRFIHGKTGEDDDSKSRISDDSRHIFQTPKLKKVDNPPTKTLRNLHGISDDSDMKLTLGDHVGESSTDDIDIGMYFEKPQLRNVPKPTETLRNVYKEKPHIDVPELKNVPKMELELKSPTEVDNKFNVPQLKSVQKERETDNQEKEEGTFQIPTLRSTPLPKRREPPKSPEAKTFDVPMLRRTPRVKPETDTVESEKPPTGVFEKPKLKSARSLQQDMDESSSKDSHVKHRFEVPSLRNTPSKKESGVQRSESVKSDHEKPSWLQDTKLKPTRGASIDSSGDKNEEKPSWLTSDTRNRHDSKENKNADSFDLLESTPRKSSRPLQETKPENGINGHQTPSRTRLTSASSEHDDDDLRTIKTTGKDQYVPSWLKTTDTRGKSPSTPNLAFVTPTKDTSEVPQWKRELAEKRRRQKDGDGAPTPMKAEPAGDKELPPWKVELGQMKMRQTPAKAQDTKKSVEPEWKKAADEKRQRLRNSGLLASRKTAK